MSKFDKYDDYYDGSSFQKIHSKGKKPKYKGHQSRHGSSNKDRWAALEVEEEETVYISTPSSQPQQNNSHYRRPAPTTSSNPAVSQQDRPQPRPFQFGENTHEIKGVKIDLDGVQGIERIENMKDGIKTFGIKFLFKGVKGLYRTIWFNRNQYERDRVYAAEYAFWIKLNDNKQS